MEGDAKQLFTVLKTAGKKSLRINYQFFGNKNHASIAHEAIYKTFEWFKF
jgi:hypothetical protein